MDICFEMMLVLCSMDCLSGSLLVGVNEESVSVIKCASREVIINSFAQKKYKGAMPDKIFASKISSISLLERQRVLNFAYAAKLSRGLVKFDKAQANKICDEISETRELIESIDDSLIFFPTEEQFGILSKIDRESLVLGEYMTSKLIKDLFEICSDWDVGVKKYIDEEIDIESICRACSFVDKRLEFLYIWQEKISCEEFFVLRKYLINEVFERLKRKGFDAEGVNLRNIFSVFY